MRERVRVSEVELGRIVVAWLEADGWEVWQEVGVSSGGGVCDIVARRGPVIHAIECKVVANLDVLYQASWWVRRAHFVSVAVPRPRRDRLYGSFAKHLGIGVLWIGEAWNGSATTTDVIAWEQGPMARIRDERFYRPLSEALTPERKSWPAEAGNNMGHRYTPFRETCDHLRRVVEAEPGITMRAAVEKMKLHHYHTDKAARAALSQWARRGKVPGVRAEPGKRAFVFYPVGTK